MAGEVDVQVLTAGGTSIVSATDKFTYVAAAAVLVSVDDSHVTPAAAKDLHLLSFYSGEQLDLPLAITNTGTQPINGTITISVYLSVASTAAPSGKPFYTLSNQSLSLLPSAQKAFLCIPTMPDKLSAGQKDYLVAKVTSNNITLFSQGNVGDSNSAYEYLGVPSYKAKILDSGLYFSFIRDTLDGISAAIKHSPNVDVTNAKSYIACWEGDSLSPYLDPNVPTIGVGINLTSLSAAVKSSLAADVRAYYTANDKKPNIAEYTGTQVIILLKSLASTAGTSTNVPALQAISTDDDQSLFDQAYKQYADRAKASLASVWDSLGNQAQIAITDLVYNAGSVWPGVASALKKPKGADYVLAGFNLVDAFRTIQAPGLTVRSEADYQNLLAGHLADIGNIVPAASPTSAALQSAVAAGIQAGAKVPRGVPANVRDAAIMAVWADSGGGAAADGTQRHPSASDLWWLDEL